LFHDKTVCAFCSVPCPSCSQPLGNITLDQKGFITALQSLSDKAPDDHKNKGAWNMILGEYYNDVLGDKDKAEKCFEIAGAAGCPQGYTNVGSMYYQEKDFSKARH
jgi:hypothetical protein